MFCRKCGKKIAEEVEFCSNCGTNKNEIVFEQKEEIIREKSVKNYTVLSIIALFICIPFAIPAICYSLKSTKKLKKGEMKEALKASKMAFIWMLASYISIVVMIPTVAILAAVALPQFGIQIEKSKDAKAISVLEIMRANLSMSIADLEGNVPRVEDVDKLWLGGETSSTLNPEIKCNIHGLDKSTTDLIEVEKDSSTGYSGYIKCGTALDKNGVNHKKIPFTYSVSREEGSEYADANLKFAAGYTDSKGNDWSNY